MTDLLPALAYALLLVHVAAGVGWLGEVLVVTFVLGPALRLVDDRSRAELLMRVFPRIFTLASILGGTAILTGAGLLWLHSGFRSDLLFGTAWGRLLLAGISLATGLYVFHLVAERKLLRLSRAVRDGNAAGSEALELQKHLRVIPPVGAAVLGTVVALMVNAANFS